MVAHGHVLVNGRKCDIPSMLVKPGDTIKVKTRESQPEAGPRDPPAEPAACPTSSK